MISRLILNIQNPRLLEEHTKGGFTIEDEVGTFVAVCVEGPELTEMGSMAHEIETSTTLSDTDIM